MNKVILIGRLVQDPELRHTNEGSPFCNFSLAVQRDFTNRDGEKETDFIDIIAWKKTGEAVAQYLKKGRLVAVTGRLQINKNEDDSGRTFINPEIIAREIKFLDANDNTFPPDPETKRKAKKESEHEFKNDREPNIDLNDMDEDVEEDIQIPF